MFSGFPFPPIGPLRRALLWWNDLSPQGLFAASFVLLIALCTGGLLWLPGLYTGAPLTPLEALFTATSATCVTGLGVVDLATRFTLRGQAWILFFIQAGGLGLFTLSTLIIGGLGRRLSLRSEAITGASIALSQRRSALALTVRLTRVTLLIEGIGALLLFALWVGESSVGEAAWNALFHAVSAFCNAGFSTFSDNLMGFAERPLTLLVISALIIVGGLGILVLDELLRYRKERRANPRARLSVHTFVVLVVTGALLFGGAALYAVFEWQGEFARFDLIDKLANAWFMSASSRTAGFNTISFSMLGNAAGFLTVLLMLIGGSPSSTAGGIKTTSVAVLVALAFSRIRGRRNVVLHGRAIPGATVARTVSLAIIAFVAMTLAVFVLSFTEAHDAVVNARQAFLPQLFEVASALGTAGLSMELTASLSPMGKLLIVGLMYMGRVGPLVFFASLALRSGGNELRELRPAHEDLIVG